MAKAVRISLANKCQILFGVAVILILTAALAVGWFRMQTLVLDGQEETARKLARACVEDIIRPGGSVRSLEHGVSSRLEQGLSLLRIDKDDIDLEARHDPFLADAVNRFRTRNHNDLFRPAIDTATGLRYYRYAQAIRKSDLLRLNSAEPALDTSAVADPLEGVILVQLRADLAERQLMLNRIYIVAAGLFAGLLAIGVFWFITTRLILSPVRVLKDTAEKIAEGDLNIRSDINTGDEFEQLSDMFNHMLERLKTHQDQLRSINKSLDLKLGELAATNVALYEANKIKGEFLANVSHELRTPLNSIIGFAEVLQETLKDRTGPVDEKRKRYASNIILSSRRLLDLINELLDLAKIEAGRIDVRIGAMSIADTIEGLANLMRPQAEKRNIALQLNVAPNIPVIQTDAGKFHQILFNFLSNAIKFTPEGGTITLSASLTAPLPVPAAPPADASAPPPPPPADPPKLRVSVRDTGPGIPPNMQERIFEKFTQLDATVTKEHGGTGLGLAISRELARFLQGRIELDSDLGKGATFSLVIPLVLEARSVPLMPELSTRALTQPPVASTSLTADRA